MGEDLAIEIKQKQTEKTDWEIGPWNNIIYLVRPDSSRKKAVYSRAVSKENHFLFRIETPLHLLVFGAPVSWYWLGLFCGGGRV